jgi:hypothetical protein
MSELDRWETRFSAPDFVFGTEPNVFLRSQAHLLPRQGKALAVADGEGRNGVWLAQQGLDALSVDFSPAAQVKVRALAKARNVALRIECLDVIGGIGPRRSSTSSPSSSSSLPTRRNASASSLGSGAH